MLFLANLTMTIWWLCHFALHVSEYHERPKHKYVSYRNDNKGIRNVLLITVKDVFKALQNYEKFCEKLVNIILSEMLS